MPANQKYLTKSPWERLAKITAGLLGGYFITVSLHILLMQWWDTSAGLITLQFGGFILWAVLFILAFLAKKGWKILLSYILAGGILLGLAYLGKVGIL